MSVNRTARRRVVSTLLMSGWALQPVWWYFVWNPGPHDPDSFMFRAAITMTVTGILFVITVWCLGFGRNSK